MLFEREGELARLSALVAAARAGDGAVAVVEGPPGIGKTALLRALAASADAAGCEVLSARGDELERGFAFGVARQLFEPRVAALPSADRAALLSGAASLAASLVDPGRQPDPSQPLADPFLLLHGLYWLAAGLADHAPLAIVVDDAHWADGPSLRWLHYLSRRLDGVAALVVLAARSTEPEAPVEELEAIKVEQQVVLLQLPALSERASGVLLGEVFDADPSAELVHEAHAATGGNPFLLCELGRSLAADGVAPDIAAAQQLHDLTPATIARSVLGRLARLPAEARELARAAALLGEDAQLRHAAALAGLDEARALVAADRLAAAGFLAAEGSHRTGSQLGFAHPLIRQALYADLAAGQRAARHKDAARLLAAEPGSAERAAAHLLETAPAADPWVTEALRRAAADAMSTGAPDVAAAYLRRALDEPPVEQTRAVVLLELGQAEAQTLDPAAITHLEAAARAASDPLGRTTALGALAYARHLQGDSAGAFAIGQEALEQIPPGAGGEPEAWLLATSCWAARTVPALVDEVRALLERPRTSAGGKTTPAELVRVMLTALDALLRGKRDLAAEQVRWAEDLLDARSLALRVWLGAVQAFLGRDRDAQATLQRTLERARRRGNKLLMGGSLDGLAYLRWRSGDLDRAIADAEIMPSVVTHHDWSPGATFTRVIIRAVCLVERGDLVAAASALELPDELEARLTETWWWLWLPYGRGSLALARDDWANAREQALTAGERALAIQAPSPDYMPWRSLAAQAAAREGDRDQALSLAREELALAREEGSPRAAGIALTTLGAIQGGEVGLSALGEAVDTLAGTSARLEHARGLCELGAALRRANRRADARAPLEAAIELARACGAAPLAERAHAELRATGARPRSLVFSGAEALTPRERQVAELAAAGRSNPEIAQALFVTRKTVETHLGAVYRKLELDSRDQLADALFAGRR